MTFKLVRTDLAEPLKIKLPVGKHIIGRGSFLNIDNISDKRVSRNHAELEVTNDTVIIKSLHQNPCFYLKKNTDETQILKMYNSITLGNGDKFGILPEKHWYEIIHCILDDTNDQIKHRPQNNIDNSSETTEIHESADNSDLTDCEFSQDFERSALPSAIGTNKLQAVNGNQLQSLLEEQPTSPKTAKRLHSIENNENSCKKVKTETVKDVRLELAEPVVNAEIAVKDEPVDAQAGPSNNQVAVSNNDYNRNNQNVTAAPVNPVAHRERCIYGANCYRRNPQHKAEFSHPSDSDWGTGERGVCPYGKDCRKRDPRHWQSHEHPLGVQPPPNAPAPGMHMVQRHGNIFYINANTVNFYDDHFEVEDSDGDSAEYDYVDKDYEF